MEGLPRKGVGLVLILLEEVVDEDLIPLHLKGVVGVDYGPLH